MNDTNAKEYYDDFSNWYEKERHHGYHAMLDTLELDVIRPLAQGADVLEVGCGTGLIMRGIQDVARSLKGIDISPGMLAEAQRRGFDVQEAGAEQLPFGDAQFDLVYSFKVLAHVPDIKQALAEMQRVLRPGGHMVAEFYNALSLRHLAKSATRPGRVSRTRREDEMYTRWDTPREVRSYLPAGMEFLGFRGVRVFTPAAVVYNLPGMSHILQPAERWAVQSPLARFGGFLIAVCRKPA
ncbi:MAG: class I SAM-dependent methyltransferase [Proteobacteria bacterium]|nr:class I SAM-dependent methyltransferase [Pseudomonadota bacterium]